MVMSATTIGHPMDRARGTAAQATGRPSGAKPPLPTAGSPDGAAVESRCIESPPRALIIAFQAPRRDRRLERMVRGACAAGQSYQRQPAVVTCRMPSPIFRSSFRPVAHWSSEHERHDHRPLLARESEQVRYPRHQAQPVGRNHELVIRRVSTCRIGSYALSSRSNVRRSLRSCRAMFEKS